MNRSSQVKRHVSHVRSYFSYCPRCAGRLEWRQPRIEAPYQRCTACGYSMFNNPIGATEAIIIRNGKMLVMRRTRQPRKGYWDSPGGFMDGFETPEHGVIREVREETGLTFKPKRLIGVYVNDQYRYHDRNVPVIVVTFLGSASGRLKHTEEASAYAWRPLRSIRHMAFRYQLKVIRDVRRLP